MAEVKASGGKRRPRFRLSPRQGLRWAVLAAAVFLVWPWRPEPGTSVYLPALSPHVALASLLALRTVTLLTVLALPVLVLTVLYPRWFCRYGCPVGLLQETLERFRPRSAKPWLRMPAIGKGLLLATLGGACLGYPVFLWLDPMAIFHGFWNAWQQPLTLSAVVAGVGLPLLLMFDFALPRLWCRRICPLGAAQDLLAWPKRLRRRPARCEEVESEPAKSGGNIGSPRRWFFAACFAGAGAAVAKTAAGRGPSPPLRPPGAAPEDRFSGLCIRCGNCVQVCPAGIIEPDLGKSGVAGLLTPKVSFETDYCREDCHECNLVCPSGAIARISLEEKKRRVIGPAALDLDTCLLAEGRECNACIQHCPYQALSILTSPDGFSTEPLVDLERCTGCGACEMVCPVRPQRAIRVNPAQP